MKIAFVQTKPEFGRIERNIESAIAMMQTTAADLYVLPELFSTGYMFESQAQLKELSESASNGYTARAMKDFTEKSSSAVIYGFAEESPEGLFNSCVFIEGEKSLKLYRKIHLFHEEKQIFTPGNLPLQIINYRGFRLGMMICFDWIFPELTRCLALMGAQIVCHPANLVLPYCQEAMKTRSIENHIFTVTANRIGEEIRGEDKLIFTGQSQFTNYRWGVIYRASPDKEEVHCADIDIGEADNKKIDGLNDLFRDRRVDFYGRLGEE